MSLRIAQLIQKQVPLGTYLIVTLKSGEKIHGNLSELARDYIVLERNGNSDTVLLEMVGAWSPANKSGATIVPVQHIVGEQHRQETAHAVLPPQSSSDTNGVHTTTDEQRAEASTQAESPTATEAMILRTLIEIETRYDVQVRNSRLQLKPPRLNVSAHDLIRDAQLQSNSKLQKEIDPLWGRIVNKYQYALRNKELGSQFGRIQPIIFELESMCDRLPKSAVARGCLGYFYYLQGDQAKALSSYHVCAQLSPREDSWFNLAAIALEFENQELACHALEQLFVATVIDSKSSEWYVYIGLLRELRKYSSLNRVVEAHKHSSEDMASIVEAAIYLMKHEGEKKSAAATIGRLLQKEDIALVARDTIDELQKRSNDNPLGVAPTNAGSIPSSSAPIQSISQPKDSKLDATNIGRKTLLGEITDADIPTGMNVAGMDERLRPASQLTQTQHGKIVEYGREGQYGFLRDSNGRRYFFHRTAIVDPILLTKVTQLKAGESIDVIFDPEQGPKGPLALNIAVVRTVEELYRLANEFAVETNYSQAIAYIKQVLSRNPNYRDATALYERWREFARISGLPSGSGPYARARRVQLVEKDLERAAKLFRQAIKEKDNLESAVKDLAQLLTQQGQTDQAIDLLLHHRNTLQDKQSVDNLLVTIYQKAGQNDKAIDILQKKLTEKLTPEKAASLRLQIGNLLLQSKRNREALIEFDQVKRLQPGNLSVQRNIAVCHFNLGEHERAEAILRNILDKTIDPKSSELLVTVQQARATGVYDEIVVSINMSNLSGELSRFSQFQLDRCEYQGVPPERVQSGIFSVADIQKLEQTASKLGTSRPKDRAQFYLSAAKVTAILEREYTSQFYRYLCRSLTSSGDAAIAEGRPPMTARAYYCEALIAVDRTLNKADAEQNGINATVRYLLTCLEAGNVPLTPQIPSIEESIERVLVDHPQRDYVLDNIAYLVSNSRFAAKRVLKPLFSAATLQTITLKYLEAQGVSIPQPPRRFDEYVKYWDELRRRRFELWRELSDRVRFLKKSELKVASLEDGIKHIKEIASKILNVLDLKYIYDLLGIYEIGLDLVTQATFEERERLCMQIDSRCDELLKEIEINPTKFSLEELYEIVDMLRGKAAKYLDDLYTSSAPQVEIRLPIESYTPDSNHKIRVQILVANRIGRSPAESLELVIPADDRFYSTPDEANLQGSLRGGEQQIFVIEMQLYPSTVQAETFSLPVYARYTTRSSKLEATPISSFSIRLYPESEFAQIHNPYIWAEGGTVSDATMFYGRSELIENIATTVLSPNSAGKSIVVFGQKRAGKSSILYHLKQNLLENDAVLVLDVGNIGAILDHQSSVPFLYQILLTILRKLQYGIDDAVNDFGKLRPQISFPTDRDFYQHPAPLTFFRDLWTQFKREAAKTTGWQNTIVVLMIDEFSYLFTEIVQGRIPDTFMKNWKAILQEGWFCAVLAGQDDMPRFKQHFPNEFGTTQDERVSYLKREDAEKLIDEPIRIGGRSGESRYREYAIDRIIDLTAGSPFYIQIVCNRLVEHMNRRKARLVTEADVEQVKNDLIRGVNALSFDKFENLISSGGEAVSSIPSKETELVLKAVADNSRIGPCNRSAITCKTTTPIDEILDDLVKRDVIEREREQYYRIRVGLFKEWLMANA